MAESSEIRKAKARKRRMEYYAKNRELERAKQAAYRAENLEKITEQQKQWRDLNKEVLNLKRKERRLKNLMSARLRDKVSYLRNRAGYIKRARQYEKALKLEQTPKWLSDEQLVEIDNYYQLAKELAWLSEEPLQVDHIVPLNGKHVTGLHVPWNLQILPRSMNISKGNR